MYSQRKGKCLQRAKRITKVKRIYLTILFTTFLVFITSWSVLKNNLAFVVNPWFVFNLAILFRWFGDTSFEVVSAGPVDIWVNGLTCSHNCHVMSIDGVVLIGVSTLASSWTGRKLLSHLVRNIWTYRFYFWLFHAGLNAFLFEHIFDILGS